MPDSVLALQICVHKLETVAAKCGRRMSTSKTKTMAFKGSDPVKSKIVVNNNIIVEQVNTFSYPRCLITYQNEKDITVSIPTFLQITVIIYRTLEHAQVQKHTRLKIYNTLALPTLLYGCETGVLTERNKSTLTSAEMKFMRRTVKYTWKDYKAIEDILLELKINQVVKKIQRYRNKSLQHVGERTETNRLPRLIMKHQPWRKRSQGRPV